MLNQSLMAHLQKAVMSNTAESVHELESALLVMAAVSVVFP
jgi:hypothetical protein